MIYCLAAIGASTQSYLLSGKPDGQGGLTMKYNNYLIFKYSYHNLKDGRDLYQLDTKQARDYFKYSPTFALLFAPFTFFPDYVGLTLWNLLNVLVLFWALFKLPALSDRKRVLLFLFVFIELLTSIQNSQSNGLIAGLLVFAFLNFENGKPVWGTLWIVLSAFIKIFGGFALLLILFYPKKWKSAVYTLCWAILFLLLPLVVMGVDQLQFLYSSWYHLLQADHASSMGISVAGLIHSVVPLSNIGSEIILGVGILMLLIAMVGFHSNNTYVFKATYLAYLLIWMVVFNHKAESPTFIIAMVGIGIWYFSSSHSKWDLGLVLFALLLTSLSSTDLFPRTIREEFIKPFQLKALPAVLIWFKITFDLIRKREESVTI